MTNLNSSEAPRNSWVKGLAKIPTKVEQPIILEKRVFKIAGDEQFSTLSVLNEAMDYAKEVRRSQIVNFEQDGIRMSLVVRGDDYRDQNGESENSFRHLETIKGLRQSIVELNHKLNPIYKVLLTIQELSANPALRVEQPLMDQFHSMIGSVNEDVIAEEYPEYYPAIINALLTIHYDRLHTNS